MAAAGVQLHPACRVRQEEFGLLFYDSRGPRLLFAETGTMLPAEFFAVARGKRELPEGLAEREQEKLEKFVNLLLEKDFLREQPLC
jgi:putative mycofactocin binding protein MftB